MKLRPILTGIIATVLFAGVVAACSLPAEQKPRAIDSKQFPLILTPNASTTTTVPASQGKTGWVCFVQQLSKNSPSKLACVPRKLKTITSDSLFEALVAGPDTEERKIGGYSSPVPHDVKLLGTAAVTNSGVLTLNLSDAITGVGNPNNNVAYHQIVKTLTDPRNGLDATAIAVKVEGERLKIPTDKGPKQVATINDFDATVSTRPTP